jgi:hypothetical protein
MFLSIIDVLMFNSVEEVGSLLMRYTLIEGLYHSGAYTGVAEAEPLSA